MKLCKSGQLSLEKYIVFHTMEIARVWCRNGMSIVYVFDGFSKVVLFVHFCNLCFFLKTC